MHKRRKKIKRNPAALFAFVIVAISGFLFPLFSFTIFGESFSDKGGVMANLIFDLFDGSIKFAKGYEMIITIMMAFYLLIALFYLLNGLGVIYNRYSRYASILSFVYLFLGALAVVMINRESSVPFFGNTLGAFTIGLGTYVIPLVGVLYLFFAKGINRRIRF